MGPGGAGHYPLKQQQNTLPCLGLASGHYPLRQQETKTIFLEKERTGSIC